jgi:predicted transcriptional regulator
MARKRRQRPTEGELAILRVLWNRGRATVREVHEALGGRQRSGYTTTLKLMQIMHDKGLVRRDERQFAHVYEPAVSEEKTQKTLVGDLLAKAFDGSVGKLVMQALAAGEVSPRELDEIRRLLGEHGKDS